jgi:hypothetical protein
VGGGGGIPALAKPLPGYGEELSIEHRSIFTGTLVIRKKYSYKHCPSIIERAGLYTCYFQFNSVTVFTKVIEIRVFLQIGKNGL